MSCGKPWMMMEMAPGRWSKGNIVKYFWHHMVPLYIVHIVYIYIYICKYIMMTYAYNIYIYTLFINTPIHVYVYIYIKRTFVHSTLQSIHIIRRSVQFRFWNVFFLAFLYTYIDIYVYNIYNHINITHIYLYTHLFTSLIFHRYDMSNIFRCTYRVNYLTCVRY